MELKGIEEAFWKCLSLAGYVAMWGGFSPFWMVRERFRIIVIVEFYYALELFDEMPNRGLSMSSEP